MTRMSIYGSIGYTVLPLPGSGSCIALEIVNDTPADCVQYHQYLHTM